MTGAPRSRAGALGLAALLFFLVLVQPNHPDAMTWQALTVFPLEWPAILLGLMAAGRGVAGLVLRVVLVAVLLTLAVLKAADYAMFLSLGRNFNPVADLALVEAGVRLLSGAIGPVLATLALVGAGMAVVLLAVALWWASGVWTRAALDHAGLRGAAAVGALVSAGVAGAAVGDTTGRWDLPARPPGAAFTARLGVERLELARVTLENLRAFKTAAATDPFADSAETMLDRIDRDVIVVFVESYGRTSLETPLYADLHRATLEDGARMLEARGLATASGFLGSPTRGGQSWLAHATVANGLWVDGQIRYRAALASNRQTLFHLAQRAGFHTAAVMPQITLDWPESSRMGFETILAAEDLGYEGLNFNWVTMPDQFTFRAMDRLLREGREGGRRMFIQVATGTSHAPWVPIPELIDWEEIGDGRVFNPMARSGDTPKEVWRDRDRVRAQYRLAIDYALQVVLSYAERHAENPPLMIVMGDHQAAGFVAQDDRDDVPIHVIGPPDLVARAAGDWGLAAGLAPPTDAPVVPMDRMRDRILETFSTGMSGAGG